MLKWIALACFALAACGGGGGVDFVPDASNAGCGLGTWAMTLTAGSGTCTTPGSTQSSTIMATYHTGGGVDLAVVGDPSFTITGTTADESGGCRLQANLTSPATGPNGESGTESDTMSVIAATDGMVSGFGASSVSGGFTCNQAISFSGTFTPE